MVVTIYRYDCCFGFLQHKFIHSVTAGLCNHNNCIYCINYIINYIEVHIEIHVL